PLSPRRSALFPYTTLFRSVLQRVQPRDLDDLPFAEMLAERPERGVGDALVTRRFLHVRQRRTLPLGEERARPVFGERVELLHSETMADRHRPGEVQAEAAPV